MSRETAVAGDGDAARAAPGPEVDYVHGNVLTHPFPHGSFDLVASIATLHHLDMAAGLQRLGELVRPGGVLVVVGLARTRLWSPPDLFRYRRHLLFRYSLIWTRPST